MANALTESLKERASQLIEQGITPTIAILRVGANGSDVAYERNAISGVKKLEFEPSALICRRLVPRQISWTRSHSSMKVKRSMDACCLSKYKLKKHSKCFILQVDETNRNGDRRYAFY